MAKPKGNPQEAPVNLPHARVLATAEAYFVRFALVKLK